MSNGHAKTAARWQGSGALGRARSGRWFVIGAVVAIALLWGALFLVFRQWRERHRELAAYGATEVATVVDPLAERVPPGVDPKAWRGAVRDTRGMLVAATGSGMMDRAGMDRLRDDLRGRVARSTPATARDDLRRLWDDMQAGFGPVLSGRASRPPHCPPRPDLLPPLRPTPAK